MYVCICNTITDKQVRTAVIKGVRRAEDVYAHYGRSVQCGRCLPEMCRLVRELGPHAEEQGATVRLPLAAE